MNKQSYTKSIFAGLLGTSIEWYDYGLFGFLAPIIAKLIFPSSNPWAGLIQAFSVFAIGYFLRPLGGMIFGSIADRFGRVAALRSTILLISLPSLLIACLPTYAMIGPSCQFALIGLRLLQGLSVGGEFAGSMVYLTEIAPPRYRTLFAGLANNASNIGVLAGVGLCSLLSQCLSAADFESYGWRIPFFLGGLLGLAGYRLRKAFMESEAFLELKQKQALQSKPLRFALKHYSWRIVLGCMLCWMGACTDYTLTVYLSTYLHNVKHYSQANALAFESCFLFLTLLLLPCASLLSLKINRVKLLKFAAAGNIVYALFAFSYLPENNLALCALLLAPLLIFLCLEQGLMPATLSELFPVAIRYSAVSLSYNLSYAYIGGAAPMYLTWLIHRFNNPLMPAYCMMIAAGGTGFALVKLFPHRNVAWMEHSDIQGAKR